MNISHEIWLDKLQKLGATVVQPQGVEKGEITYEESPLIEIGRGDKPALLPNTLDLKYILIRFGSSSANLFNHNNRDLYRKWYGPYGIFTSTVYFDEVFLYFMEIEDGKFESFWDSKDHTNRKKRLDLEEPEALFTHHIVPWSAVTHLMTKSKFIFE